MKNGEKEDKKKRHATALARRRRRRTPSVSDRTQVHHIEFKETDMKIQIVKKAQHAESRR